MTVSLCGHILILWAEITIGIISKRRLRFEIKLGLETFSKGKSSFNWFIEKGLVRATFHSATEEGRL